MTITLEISIISTQIIPFSSSTFLAQFIFGALRLSKFNPMGYFTLCSGLQCSYLHAKDKSVNIDILFLHKVF